jgi:hypothetical protein
MRVQTVFAAKRRRGHRNSRPTGILVAALGAQQQSLKSVEIRRMMAPCITVAGVSAWRRFLPFFLLAQRTGISTRFGRFFAGRPRYAG